MRKLMIFLLSLLLMVACSDDDRERLFDMPYPDIQFEIPAGLSATLPRVFERDNLATNIEFFLQDNDLETEMITAINPVAAQITAIDNINYNFVREISVRICDAGSEACGPADEVFFIDRLDEEQVGRVVELLPSLRSAKRNLIQERFKLEVVFFFTNTTPFVVESRLDMRFEAVR